MSEQKTWSDEELEQRLYAACSVTIAGTATIFKGIAKTLTGIAKEYASQQLEQSNVPRWVKAEERLPDERMWNYVGRWKDGEYCSCFIINAGKRTIIIDGKNFTRENAHRDFEWLKELPQKAKP